MLMIDCQVAGISGDMLLSALLDLGANKDRLIDTIFKTQEFLDGSRINDVRFEECKRYGIRALLMNIDYRDDVEYRRGIEVEDAIERCSNRLDLDNRARIFALNSIRAIIRAEAKIHGEDYNDVHLHEASSIDTVIDIIGTAVALQDLEIFNDKVYASKVAVGGGLLKFSHGIIPNPSNAVLEILKDRFIIVGGMIDKELTTPTGASLLANLAECSLDYYPTMKVSKIGYGAGKNDFAGIPNVLRLVRGEQAKDLIKDSVVLLETNIDDASGETLGDLIDLLFDAGAKDVSIIPALTKKNRLASIVRVIADHQSLAKMIDLLIKESGTLGIRVQNVDRYILDRSIVSIPININNEVFTVRVKVARYDGKIVSLKAEYEDLKSISNKLGLSLSLTRTLVDKEISSRFKL